MPDTNGSYVTRAEMTAHVRRLEDNLSSLKEDIHDIREAVEGIHQAVGAGPRWMSERFTSIIDKLLPVLLAAAALWVLSGRGVG